MKLVEGDEDETMQSGAAFIAALNRDIEGDSSSFQNSDSDTTFAQGSNQTTNRFPQWQTSNLDENANCQNQQGVNVSQQQEINHGSGSENQQQQFKTSKAMNIMNRKKQVPFALLVPFIEPQLDKDKALQFQTIYNKLKANEITKDVFVRHMRSILGDQVLKTAVYKLQGQVKMQDLRRINYYCKAATTDSASRSLKCKKLQINH